LLADFYLNGSVRAGFDLLKVVVNPTPFDAEIPLASFGRTAALD